MAHEAKNLSETFTFKILHMLNISTCILLGTEKQKEARPCGSCTGTTACISQNKGWRKLWSDSQRLSDWACEEKRRCHLTPLYLTPALEETGQGISGWAGAEDGHCSSCRDTDSAGWTHETAKCHGTGTVWPCWCPSGPGVIPTSDLFWEKRACPCVWGTAPTKVQSHFPQAREETPVAKTQLGRPNADCPYQKMQVGLCEGPYGNTACLTLKCDQQKLSYNTLFS